MARTDGDNPQADENLVGEAKTREHVHDVGNLLMRLRPRTMMVSRHAACGDMYNTIP